MGEPPFSTETGNGSPEDLQRSKARDSATRVGRPSRSRSPRILDEKQGLATGQPEIKIADSPHFYRIVLPDENPNPGPRGLRHF